MWREVLLKIPDALQPLSCSVVPAHPWVYGLGQQTANGVYLSPINALNYLAAKLNVSGGQGSAIIFMVCNATYGDFIRGLNDLAAVFPAPMFQQVARYAVAAAELSTVKMQLPARPVGGLPAAIPLSVPTTRLALNAQRIAAAQHEAAAGNSPVQLIAQLLEFAQARADLLSSVSKELEDLKAGSARVYAFTHKGDYNTAAAELLKDIPQLTAVFTAAVMFIGNDLTALESMIHA